MMHAFGEIEISQSEKAYKASMVLSGETPAGRCIRISTNSAVLSSIFLILIFPLSLALITESINVEVVVANGSSVIFNNLASTCSIRARTFILPPL